MVKQRDVPADATEPSAPPPSPAGGASMTYEQFLDWLDEDTLAEWVDGKVVIASLASDRHQEIAASLFELLRTFVKIHALGVVRHAPFQMRLNRPSGREPDLLYVAEAHRDRIKETYLDGPADLVVEIVSPESAGRDRGDKFYEYQAAGIPEYWLIDAERETAEFYQLDERGRYQLVPADANGAYYSRMLAGLWLRVAWLWQQPLPDAVDALLEIDGDAYARYLRERLRDAGR